MSRRYLFPRVMVPALFLGLLLGLTASSARAADFELYGGGGGGGSGASNYGGGGGGSAGNSIGAGGGGQGGGGATSTDIDATSSAYGGAGGAGGGEGAAATGPGMNPDSLGGNGSGGGGTGVSGNTTLGGAGAVNGSLSGGTGGTGSGGRRGGGGGGAGGGTMTSSGGMGGAAANPGSDGINGGGGGGGSSSDGGVDGSRGGNGSLATGIINGGNIDDVRLAGGGGGGGGSSYSGGGAGGGSGGGGGGSVAITATTDFSAASITLTGGRGGDGGHNLQNNTGASGGAGGTAGQGGAGGGANSTSPSYGGGGGGGGGGSATLNAAGHSVTLSGSLNLTSGARGADGQAASGADPAGVGQGGAGGEVAFSAGTLSAPSINLSKPAGGGNLTFTVTTLNAGADTSFNLSGTAAGDVSVTTLNLANNSLLSLNNSAGAMSIQSLNVGSGQSGRLFVSNGNQRDIAALNAAGANLTFMLPSTLQADDTVLSVGNANLTGATLGLAYASARPGLDVGQGFTLLDATSLTTDITTLTVRTANGDVYTLNVSGDQLLAVLDHIAPTTPAYERLKAYAEGRAATLGFVNQGQDLILNQGFGSALAATSGSGLRMNAFSGASGGISRYDSGSHVDMKGFSMLAGMAVGNDAGPGRLTLGAFFEGGWGSYDSYNSFGNYASVKGNGNTSYLGGGILGRYDLTSGALSGLYVDASARMGRAQADFRTDDITYNGSNANFDSASPYYGLHGGLGYVWNISEAASLDLSAKLLWTRQEGDSVSVHGDRVRFRDADSLRGRLGGRFTYAVNDVITPYAGAYWEHEFDGKVRATVNGNGIEAPELEGDTGMGELGLSFRPFTDGAVSGLSFDLGLQAYIGKREGVSGSFQLKFEF